MKCPKKQSNTKSPTDFPKMPRKTIELVFTPAALRRVMKESIEKRTTKIHHERH